MSRSLINHLFFTVVFFMLSVSQAHAHSSAVPQHGGIVELTGEMAFELVIKDKRVELYVVDDGKPADTSKMVAKLKVRTADGTTDIELKPDGDNRFAADGVEVPTGAKVLAIVTLANGFTKSGANFDIE